MRQAPPIIPETEHDIYLVLDTYGRRHGRAWAETGEECTDRDTLLRDLMEGQYSRPWSTMKSRVTAR
ncbi:hypothetical protein [Bradyrhizobium liaoningense]|uniref:hypothetical protein n=1 Tax=Bradyrhizobium liaoningense TaxID=43992 RepID=UPI001BA6D2FF|nr:hypothetical protein [Bradyrhizobium liaoningense]MBR0821449.1 hypothetical protein [Bradyrhizobium liaoningense]